MINNTFTKFQQHFWLVVGNPPVPQLEETLWYLFDLRSFIPRRKCFLMFHRTSWTLIEKVIIFSAVTLVEVRGFFSLKLSPSSGHCPYIISIEQPFYFQIAFYKILSMAASVYSRRPPLWNNLLSITTTQKSVQVIFGTIYTAQNNHLYIATKDHILTVPNILPNLIYNQYLIYLLKIFLNHKKYPQKIYVYQLKYLNE